MTVGKEHRKRSVIKCLTWRLVAFVDTVVLSLVFTGSIAHALAIGGIEVATKSSLYYLHERMWLTIAVKLNRYRFFNIDTFSETTLCSGFKTVSWRIIGSIDTFVIALVITGDLTASSAIGIAEVFTKITFYYLHERLWARISWGKVSSPTHRIAPRREKVALPEPVVQT